MDEQQSRFSSPEASAGSLTLGADCFGGIVGCHHNRLPSGNFCFMPALPPVACSLPGKIKSTSCPEVVKLFCPDLVIISKRRDIDNFDSVQKKERQMPPKPGSESDQARGRRLKAWLKKMAPDVKASYRGQVVLEVARQTVHNWTKGSKISNEGICKIIEVGGYDALAYILGTKPCVSNAKNTQLPDKTLMHGKGTRFWYHQYVQEKAKTILSQKQDYSKIPDHARDAMYAADEYARLQAGSLQSAGSKKPRAKGQNYL